MIWFTLLLEIIYMKVKQIKLFLIFLALVFNKPYSRRPVAISIFRLVCPDNTVQSKLVFLKKWLVSKLKPT